MDFRFGEAAAAHQGHDVGEDMAVNAADRLCWRATTCAAPRSLLRTRCILDEDVDAPVAVNVEGPLIPAEGKDGNTLMETDEHAAVIRRLYGAFFSAGRVDLAEELHGRGFVYHDVTHPDQVVDPSQVKFDDPRKRWKLAFAPPPPAQARRGRAPRGRGRGRSSR